MLGTVFAGFVTGCHGGLKDLAEHIRTRVLSGSELVRLEIKFFDLD